MSKSISLPLCALLLATQPLAAAEGPRLDAQGGFHALVEDITERAITSDPELRSMLGLTGGAAGDLSDRLTDVSLPRRQVLRDELDGYLAEVEAWDRDALTGQERWSHDLVTWYLENQVDLMSYDWSPAWLPSSAGVYAVDQLFSIPVHLPQFMDHHHAVADTHDAERYIVRLRAIETKLDQVRANFDLQAGQGVVPPRGRAGRRRGTDPHPPGTGACAERIRPCARPEAGRAGRLAGCQARGVDAIGDRGGGTARQSGL